MENISGRVRGEIRSIRHKFIDKIMDHKLEYALIAVGFISMGAGKACHSFYINSETEKAMLSSGAKTYESLATIVCNTLRKCPELSELAKLCETNKDLTLVQLKEYNRIARNLYK